MNVSYFYCHSCGLEDVYLHVEFVRSTGSGDSCRCPGCGSESEDFVRDE